MKKTILPIFIAGLIVIASTSLAATVGVMPRQLQIDNTTAPLGTGYIAGTITNSSGAPQENAHVVAFAFGIIGGPTIAIASTATNGNYELTVPEGRCHVIAFKFGEGVAFASPVVVEVGKTTDLDLSLTGGLFNGSVPGSQAVSSQPVNGQSTPLNTGGEAIVESVQVVGSNAASIETVGKGTITGTITNQKGTPIFFVRVSAFSTKNDSGREFGFCITHLLIGGKGSYSLRVPAGRQYFVRAAKLPLYLGAWAGPVYVDEGDTIILDLSITYIGPDNVPTFTGFMSQGHNANTNQL
jgi:hypothetical protein